MIEVRRTREGDPLEFEVIVREGQGETRHHAAKRERGMPGPYEEPALLMRRAPDTDTSWLDVTTFGRIFGN